MTQEWLAAKLADVNTKIVSGQRLASWGSGDANATRTDFASLHPERIRDMLMHDLHVLDPDAYPADQLQVHATTARFRDDV